MTALRKVVAYTLISVLLFTKTEAHQLLNLPFLVMHYIEHACSDKERMSVSEFLGEHLHHDHDHASGKDECPDIPFDCCDFVHIVFSGLISEPDDFCLAIPSAEHPVFSGYVPPFTGEVSLDFWQPPKI